MLHKNKIFILTTFALNLTLVASNATGLSTPVVVTTPYLPALNEVSDFVGYAKAREVKDSLIFANIGSLVPIDSDFPLLSHPHPAIIQVNGDKPSVVHFLEKDYLGQGWQKVYADGSGERFWAILDGIVESRSHKLKVLFSENRGKVWQHLSDVEKYHPKNKTSDYNAHLAHFVMDNRLHGRLWLEFDLDWVGTCKTSCRGYYEYETKDGGKSWSSPKLVESILYALDNVPGKSTLSPAATWREILKPAFGNKVNLGAESEFIEEHFKLTVSEKTSNCLTSVSIDVDAAQYCPRLAPTFWPGEDVLKRLKKTMADWNKVSESARLKWLARLDAYWGTGRINEEGPAPSFVIQHLRLSP